MKIVINTDSHHTSHMDKIRFGVSVNTYGVNDLVAVVDAVDEARIDGLGALREIIHNAPPHLVPGGWLLLEHGFDQAPAVQALLRQRGFEHIASRDDLAGIVRCTGGRWP